MELLTISGYFVQFKPSSYGEDSPDIPRKLSTPEESGQQKRHRVCVCTVSCKDDDGKISRAAFFCWWPNLLLRSLPSSPVFGSFPGKEGDQQRAEGVCGRELPVCVRASERA